MLSTTPETLQIERVIHVGPDRLLLWSLPLETGGRFYRNFRFVRNDSDELQYEGVATEPISGLITNAFQIGQESGADDRDASEFTYDYVFPGTDRYIFVLTVKKSKWMHSIRSVKPAMR